MKALEFQTNVTAEKTLRLPEEVAAQLGEQQFVRVLLLVQDDDDERSWVHFAQEQFLKGYVEGDAIYDHLPAR